MGVDAWTPAGEENVSAIADRKDDTAAIVLCNSDDNAKAISSWVQRKEAERPPAGLASSGLWAHQVEVKLPV